MKRTIFSVLIEKMHSFMLTRCLGRSYLMEATSYTTTTSLFVPYIALLDSGALASTKPALAEHHGQVNLPIPKNLVITSP